MKTIYLDSEYMCHLTDSGSMIEIQTDVFDETADVAIPYYRYIPENTKWVDERGRVFYGLFVQATDSDEIDRATKDALIADMRTALDILGVTK